MAIFEGATFKSFEDFETALNSYQIAENKEYVRKSSKSIEDWNKANTRKTPFNTCLKFKYAYYECTFGKPRDSESTGIRTNQR